MILAILAAINLIYGAHQLDAGHIATGVVMILIGILCGACAIVGDDD